MTPNDGPCPGQSGLALTALITCFNESAYIAATIDTVVETLRQSGHSYEIVVVDDRSRDDSVDVIRKAMAKYSQEPIRLYVNPQNRGLANNMVDGAFYAQGRYFRLICGDSSEPVDTTLRLLRHLGQADLILPYYRQSDIKGRSLTRKTISRLYTWIVNTLSGQHVHYYNGCPVFLTHDVRRYPPVTFGFGFQADLVTRLLDEDRRFMQVPIGTVIERKGPDSTALCMRNLLSVVHTFLEILFRRIRRLIYHRELPKAVEIFPEAKR